MRGGRSVKYSSSSSRSSSSSSSSSDCGGDSGSGRTLQEVVALVFFRTHVHSHISRDVTIHFMTFGFDRLSCLLVNNIFKNI